MNGNELLRIVDAIHRDKGINQEIVFEGIEQAILSAVRRHYGEECEFNVQIDRTSGEPSVQVDGRDLTPDELGRIAAQTAKQVMIQKIREAERDSLYDEYQAMKGQTVSGAVTRMEGGTANINLGKVEGILPRGEQIPGETHRVGERVRAVVLDVKKSGSRVKIILSRSHPDLVRRLFELEIPEVSERIIDVRSLAREAGYRSKVAVSCIDNSIDCVGACVGVRGSRIKNIVDELAGERIDIVRWNDSLQVLVPNALQPAEVEEVILCPMLGRVIVLVRDDQLSLAIGKKGQNVRLASKLVGWDIEVMTREELNEQLDKSVQAFSSIAHVTEDLAENLVSQGFFSFYDLSVIEPDQLAELGGLTEEQVNTIVERADEESAREEAEEEATRQAKRMAAYGGAASPAKQNGHEPESTVAAAPETDETAQADETDELEGEAETDETPNDDAEVVTEENDDELRDIAVADEQGEITDESQDSEPTDETSDQNPALQ
ncbi:MAG: transcription termination factor NusA [Planctomycetota bacterium]|nr:transcription termination factor NusA [Planctomycetota bacterium]